MAQTQHSTNVGSPAKRQLPTYFYSYNSRRVAWSTSIFITAMNKFEEIVEGSEPEAATQQAFTKRRDPADDDLGYFVAPKDPDNRDETDKIEEFLQQLTGVTVFPTTIYRGVFQFWMVYNMTAAQVEEVRKYPGIGSVDQDIAYKPSKNLMQF
ncbi:hypothetical protein GLAREA_00064 [Glarea lozoyensis ATCC 20868]|uniref:Uncharacterized protein n=1 Tax=Glarea lozoyensis (strain ATCC 20868 / MF5171) TaxID=1116229 RepID=S3DAB0_GLAL2|nr:uncharacterized protein GLAREA_00064 [Glarea lozoyensis ATCC 20868]EPE28906.1 hypothetical protein GLAREA_00064 [Glarea lozoyensis ATCC 20868]